MTDFQNGFTATLSSIHLQPESTRWSAYLDQDKTVLGANYKKNLKIVLRCDNNLR